MNPKFALHQFKRPMVLLAVCLTVGLIGHPAALVAQQAETVDAPTIVDKKVINTNDGKVVRGRFRVLENPANPDGRKIHLRFSILRAQSKTPEPDPLFFFAGGPGQASSTLERVFRRHWAREKRDIVLLSQRGTSDDNRLAFEFKTEGDTLQQYLDPLMDDEMVTRNRDRLSKTADLRMYSTPIAMDDVNEFRKAMGYDKINIAGGSYGTRACLVYMRRHGATVRTATLAGCAPIEFRNPLYHAEGAQRALDLIFDEVEASNEYKAAFGDIRKKFTEIVERLEDKPVTVNVTNRSTGNVEKVQMDLNAFMASVRFQMYYSANSRLLPKLLCDAHEGNFRPFVISALRQNINLRHSLALGMLLSVTTAEDVLRIDPAEVDGITKGSFFGDSRVRAQISAAKIWPKSDLPEGYGDPVRSDVPTLILSGSIDPVTPPKWGAMVHENLSNSVHLVIPAAHDIGGPCVENIRQQFLRTGSVKELKTTCVERLALPRLELPYE